MESYRILRVDLTAQTATSEIVPEPLIRSFIGGKGLAAHYIAMNLPVGADPLGPENLLVFMAGPVTGVFPGTCRFVVATKSPLTYGFNDSYAGGYLAWELRRAGFLGILVTGRSESLVYLRVADGEATFHDAKTLAGKSAAEVDDDPLFEGFRVAAVGPAAENGVAFANIANNAGRTKKGRFGYNGRGGAGLVMGAKGLKAIAVRGSEPMPHLSEEDKAFRKEFTVHMLDEGTTASNLTRAGTVGLRGAHEHGPPDPHSQLAGGQLRGH